MQKQSFGLSKAIASVLFLRYNGPKRTGGIPMKASTYIERGKFALPDKSKPEILDPRDAVGRVTLGAVCTGDLHSKHGAAGG